MRGDRNVFRNVSFSLEAGTFLQLTGPNGSGKTSLLRILCKLLPAAAGEIRWNGEDIHSLGEDYFTAVTYLGHKHGVKDELTAIENVLISSGVSGIQLDEEAAAVALQKLGLADRQHLQTRLLSEGQRRRVALARLAVSQAKLWLLDEVTTSLDKHSISSVRSLIENHLAGGGIAIVATHQELQLSSEKAQRVELAT